MTPPVGVGHTGQKSVSYNPRSSSASPAVPETCPCFVLCSILCQEMNITLGQGFGLFRSDVVQSGTWYCLRIPSRQGSQLADLTRLSYGYLFTAVSTQYSQQGYMVLPRLPSSTDSSPLKHLKSHGHYVTRS